MKQVLLSLSLALPSLAFAHAPDGAGGGFFTGFLHPILGLDHLIVLVAVGLWGAFLSDRALWIFPIMFPSITAVGAAIGIFGFEVPLVEFVIALSGVVMGALIALRFKVQLSIAMILVSIFALFHGYAHGTDIPGYINSFTYGAGFVIGTGLLHLMGSRLVLQRDCNVVN